MPVVAAPQGVENETRSSKRSNIPALVGSIGAALTTGGPTYAFGLYGAALKKNLGLSQGDIDTISTAFFVAGLMSWAPGLFADRFGARLAICIGGITGCCSLMMYWLIAKEYIVIQSHFLLVSLLSLLGVFTFESSAMVTGSVFKVLTVTSGANKGVSVGVAKGLVGLGSGVYTCIFESLKTSSESDLDFLPMAAVLFFCCATVPSFFLIPSRKELLTSDNFTMDAKDWHFRLLYCGLLGMGFLIIWNSLAELFQNTDEMNTDGDDQPTIRPSGRSSATAAVLLSLWWGPLIAIYCSERFHYQVTNEGEATTDRIYQTVQSEDNGGVSGDDQSGTSRDENDEGIDDSIPTTRSQDAQDTNRLLAAENETGQSSESYPPVLAHSTPNHPDRNLLEMLTTPDAFCLLWSATIMVGSGTVETNNMGQMVEALGLSPKVTPAGMALFSVAQAAARVVTGASSEMTLQRYGWPRTVYVVFAAVVGVLAHLMMGIATTEAAFVLGATLSGVNFGMIWPLLVLCVGEIFGTSHVGANYLFYDGFASGAGTFLLSKIVAQSVYEHHINPATAPDPYTCIGAECFRMTHYVIALCCLTCVVSSYAFVVITKDVYQPLPVALDDGAVSGEEESEGDESFSDEPEEDDIEMDFGME